MSLKQRIKDLIPAPVLAFREQLNIRRQANKTPREIFSEVYAKKAWGGEKHDFFSGFGSHAQEAVEAYVAAIKPVLATFPHSRVTDLGCGDFNIGKQIRPLCGPYIACDVVPELIERNKIKFADMDVDFRALDITSEPIPAGDIALVRQVLQHLNNSQIAGFLKGMRGYKALIVTEHLPDGHFIANADKPTGGGIRLHGSKRSGVDLTDPPFNLKCESYAVLAEVHEQDAVLRTTVYYRPSYGQLIPVNNPAACTKALPDAVG